MTPTKHLAIISEALINGSAEYIFGITDNYALMTEWDHNFLEGRKVIDISDDTFINTIHTKKIGFIKGLD